MGMRVGLYSRVSTLDQATEGYSLPIQQKILAKYAKAMKAQFELYEDDGISGESLDRPAMQRLLADVRARKLDRIVAVDQDRYSRNLGDWLKVVDACRVAGVELATVGKVFDLTDPSDVFMSHVQGAVSQYERAQIKARTMRGKLEAVRSGKYLSSIPPVGYSSQNGYLVIDEAEAKLVREIFAMAKAGRAIRAITRELNRRGVPTPMRRRQSTRAGTAWSKSTVGRILRAKLYTGEAAWNRRLHPKSEWIPVEVPAIISREDFDTVQSLLEKNAAFVKRHTKHDYLLRGLLYCECGARMWGTFSKGARRYVCSAKCGRWSVRADDEERRAFTHAFRALENPGIVAELKRKARADNPKRTAVAERLAEIDSRLERLPKERERAVDAYQSGFIDKADAQRRVNRIDKLGSRLEKERKTLQARGAKIVSQEARRAAWLQAVEALRAAKANPSKSRRKKARFASLKALLTEWRDGEAPPREVLDLKQKVIRGVFERITHRQDGGSEYVAAVPIKGQPSGWHPPGRRLARRPSTAAARGAAEAHRPR